MAVKYYTAASGNWSTAGNWNSGTVPQSGDDVYANGKTITVDTNITVTKISSEVCPDTSVGGGEFRFTANRTIACNIVAGSTQCVQIATAGVTLTIVGSVYGGSGTSARGMYLNQATITLNITGNLYGGSGSIGAYAIGQSSSYNAITVNVIGSIYGGSGSRGIVLPAGIVNVTGYVYADNLSAIVSDTVTVNGEIWGSSSIAAITEYTSLGGTVNVTGLVYNASSKMAINANRVTMSSTSLCGWRFYDPAVTAVMLYGEGYINAPAESDVRSGVTYDINKTGTCAVPPASSVRIDVPVDNTVGSYEASGPTVEDIVTGITESTVGVKVLSIPDNLATTDDVADILKAISEVTGTTPEQIVNYLLTTKLGKRLLKCTIENVTGVVRRITD